MGSMSQRERERARGRFVIQRERRHVHGGFGAGPERELGRTGEEKNGDAVLGCCGWAVGTGAAERANCWVGRGKKLRIPFLFSFPISKPHSNMNQIKFE